MSFWVLTCTGKVILRTTVQKVTNLELQIEENKTRMNTCTSELTERIGGNDFVAIDENGNEFVNINDWDDPAFNAEFVQEFGRTINDPSILEADRAFTPDSFDNTYLHMELAQPREGVKCNLGE